MLISYSVVGDLPRLHSGRLPCC